MACTASRLRLRFRSTPPGRGRLGKGVRERQGAGVSIHAPGEGATGPPAAGISRGGVSIHAPGEGATRFHLAAPGSTEFRSTPPGRGRRFAMAFITSSFRFRSTPPGRGRPRIITMCYLLRDVSIHAPGEGATYFLPWTSTIPSGFDPRPRGGGDPGATSPYDLDYLFRSTPPGRGRPTVIGMDLRAQGFRSTPPGRGRPDHRGSTCSWWQFRSTPPGRGRHRGAPIRPPGNHVSIHAPGEGATRITGHGCPA